MSSEDDNVKLSIQSLYDHKIKEIDFNGCETFTKPFTLSESLTDLANKIDFLKTEDKEDEDVVVAKNEWPWQKIRTSVSSALIEMNVLVDILSIAHNKQSGDNLNEDVDANRYILFDTAVKEPPADNKALQLITKKRSLKDASSILLTGAERLQKVRSEIDVQTDYHRQLLSLRKLWRLRRQGDRIRGDLTFASVGSMFGHPGSFDVIKTVVDPEKKKLDEKNKISPLSVSIRNDLRSNVTIRVSIIDRSKNSDQGLCPGTHVDICADDFYVPLNNPNIPEWHIKLCRAQNVIFCKELFAILTNEAIRYVSDGTVAPFVVINNCISAQIFADTEMLIEYCNNDQITKKENEAPRRSNTENLNFIKNKLMRLLQESHYRKLNVSAPKPSCAALGVPSYLRIASTSPENYRNLTSGLNKQKRTLIESTIEFAKLHVIKKRVKESIEKIQSIFPCKRIQLSPDTNTSDYESSITTAVYDCALDDKSRLIAQITFFPDKVKIFYENTILELEPNHQSICSCLLHFLCQQHIMSTKMIANCSGWKCVLQSPLGYVQNNHSEQGFLILTSSSYPCSVSYKFQLDIRYGLMCDILVKYIVSEEEILDEIEDDSDSMEVTDLTFPNFFNGFWQKVDEKSIKSKNYLKKLEYVLFAIARFFHKK